MRIPLISNFVEKRASYHDSITELLLRAASGGDSDATQTAAAEFAISLVSRCFSVAELSPSTPYVTPGYLADVARRLMTNGNAVSAIQVHIGQVTLLPTSGFDIRGGPNPSSWYYNLDLPGPTRRESQVLPSASVIHGRINVGPTQPWLGISALVHAGVSAKAIANLENRLSQEASSRVGYNLLHSSDLTTSQISALKTSLDQMAGNIGLMRSQSNSFDSRGAVGGSADGTARRLGMDYPEGNIKVRRDLAMDVVAALGVPPMLFDAQTGTAAQEGYRQFYASTLEPYAMQFAHELGEKLERPGLRLMLDRVAASDIVRRATGFAKLIEAEIPELEARRIAGVR